MPASSSFDMPDTPVTNLQRQMAALSRRFQSLLDSTLPFAIPRWSILGVSLVIFIIRIFLLQGWYIITYALFIYLLQLFLLFLSPKLDPALESLTDDDDDLDVAASESGATSSTPTGGRRASFLPTQHGDEFRPFIRRLPEFKFWWKATRATGLAFFCTFFSVFDVPVFWPILVIYFFVLFAVTMRRQIRHMIKYKYVPFTVGKPKYGARK
ncbi:protein RER1 [Catenaria anguillulae PL171]|uniref:Protein RER1 n=1 Tax=Catenaria anguillulae PL171 TaxID=765915 RepID=A0A1Y2HAK6_9FUNG|nr:protein RER1 [Catenaria anguillulae PL171]